MQIDGLQEQVSRGIRLLDQCDWLQKDDLLTQHTCGARFPQKTIVACLLGSTQQAAAVSCIIFQQATFEHICTEPQAGESSPDGPCWEVYQTGHIHPDISAWQPVTRQNLGRPSHLPPHIWDTGP